MTRSQRTFLAASAVVLAIQLAFIAARRLDHSSDFDIAREFGRRFLAHEFLYRQGLHFPYLPAAAMAFAPLALLPAWLGFALRYAFSLAILCLALSATARMFPWRNPPTIDDQFAAAAAAVVLGLQYILRDLGDAGPHLILLGLAVGGLYCAWRGWDAAAGPFLGLAIAVKLPLALTLPYFAWKRRWRLFLSTAIATALWIAAPALWMGGASWLEHHRVWARAVLPFVVRSAPVSAPESGRAPVTVEALDAWPNNQSLPAVIARNLPSGPVPPRPLASLLVAGMVAAVAWWMRRRAAAARDPAWLVESSAVLILAALLSPIAWHQHFVFALPALYAIAARYRTEDGLGRLPTAAMALYAILALVLNRELLGRDLSYRLHGYGLHALAMLLVLGVAMSCRPRLAPRGERRSAPERHSRARGG